MRCSALARNRLVDEKNKESPSNPGVLLPPSELLNDCRKGSSYDGLWRHS